MTNLLRSEFRKFTSTRMWWILIIVMVGYMAFNAAIIAATFSLSDMVTGATVDGSELTMDPSSVPSTVYTLASTMGYIFPALIGVMSFTGEFRHKTITPTLIATPQRGKVMLAKLLSGVPLGLIYGTLGTFACVGAGALVLSLGDVSSQLGTGYAWEIIGRSVLSLTLWLVFGVALGSVITNQAVAIVVLIAFTQLVEPILRAALPMWDATEQVAKFLPGAVGDSIAGGSFYNSFTGASPLGLSAGLALMIVYIAALALLGRATTLRRDIA